MNIVADAPLRDLNTLHLPASARWLASVGGVDELVALVEDPRFAGVARRILGGGSNIVLRGTPVDALIIRLAFGGWRIAAEQGDCTIIEADAGMGWHALVTATVNAGYGGIENLALIPGTVGAAPVQNIGAYGAELATVFDSLDAVHLESGAQRIFSREDCTFGYRDSVFKHEATAWAIVRVRLRLSKSAPVDVSYRDLREELAARGDPLPTRLLVYEMVCAIRRRKLPDPARVGNVGSFFKNPVVDRAQFDGLRRMYPDVVGYPQADGSVKLAAGWLIDRAGWKGRREGDVGVHDRQALVLVNHGQADGAALLDFAARIVSDVQARFGVPLEQEPGVW